MPDNTCSKSVFSVETKESGVPSVFLNDGPGNRITSLQSDSEPELDPDSEDLNDVQVSVLTQSEHSVKH